MIARHLLAAAVAASIAAPTTATATTSAVPLSITAAGFGSNIDTPTPAPVPTRTPAPTDAPSVDPTEEPSSEPTQAPPEGHDPYDPQDPDDERDPAAPEDHEVTISADDAQPTSMNPAVPKDDFVQSSLRLIDPATGETSDVLTVDGLGRFLASPTGKVTHLPDAPQPGRWTMRYAVTPTPNGSDDDEEPDEVVGRIIITVTEPTPEPEPTPAPDWAAAEISDNGLMVFSTLRPLTDDYYNALHWVDGN